MRSLHSRHAFAALDKLIDRHYIMSMTTEISMTDTVSSRLINDLHIAEVGFEAALNYKDYVSASWWRGEINSLVGQLELALLMDDPATTMADVRFFEGFKYV
jgi:hypothetical protein